VLWLVANADRGLPFSDGSLDLALSITARRTPGECARALGPAGLLVVAVPGGDDLAELRAAALGTAAHEDRVPKILEEHAAHFRLLGRHEARERRCLAPALLEDLMVATYRGGRAGRLERVAALEALEVTLSQEILVFGRRDARAG
jgi:23S rRNA (guanine745-N1)-methyltransferase